jgi:hypothetical protein
MNPLVNARGSKGKTALHYACFNGNKDMALSLIKNKAKYQRCDQKYTPVMYARQNGHFELASDLEHRYGFKSIMKKHTPVKVTSIFDHIVSIIAVFIYYFDIFTDILSIMVFYLKSQYKYFILALMFNIIPLMLSVILQKGKGVKLMALFQIIIIREIYYSIRGKIHTPMLSTLIILESVVEACPSALLQSYVLLLNWIENPIGFISMFSSKILLLSIIISIITTSKTLMLYITTDESKYKIKTKSILVWFNIIDIPLEYIMLYHIFEEIFKLITYSCLYVILGVYGVIIYSISYICRGYFALYVYHAEQIHESYTYREIMKVFLRISLSTVTDCV